MGDKTAIEWTDATWNPVRGCSIVSKGCTNCYAMKQAHRSSGAGGAYEGLTKLTKGGPVWTGEVRPLGWDAIVQPLRWARERLVFVNSMSDLFHESLDFEFIDKVFGVMAITGRHTYQVLTKRPARMLQYLESRHDRDGFPAAITKAAVEAWQRNDTHGLDTPGPAWPLANVWLGVSVEDQAAADERIPLLLHTPAAVRWISAEPLLGPISFEGRWVEHPNPAVHVNWLEELDWVVAGGESGPGARPMHPDWARSLRDQCASVGTAFFFKQWGAWLPRTDYYSAGDHRDQWCDRAGYGRGVQLLTKEGQEWVVGDPGKGGRHDGQPPDGTWVVQRLDKKTTGRELDGRTHDEYPA
jgi:protein gp37